MPPSARRRAAGRPPGLPARGPDVRRLGLALPPARMPLWRRRSVLKRWRYVGVFTRELLLCVGDAAIGPLRRRWWAIAEPDGSLHGETASRPGRGGVRIEGPRVRVAGGPVEIDLRLGQGEPVETLSAVGERGNYIWTAKRAGVMVQGSVRIGQRKLQIDGRHAFVDDSAGYHARHTTWTWSAGLGSADDGRRIAWNLVTGVHDAAQSSERTLWVDGRPSELGPVRFSEDLAEVSFAEGGALHFREWAAREEHTNMWLVRSSLRQPFGAFEGDLPGVRLAEGHGVMEAHDVWW